MATERYRCRWCGAPDAGRYCSPQCEYEYLRDRAKRRRSDDYAERLETGFAMLNGGVYPFPEESDPQDE
jgi:hypothetical protein